MIRKNALGSPTVSATEIEEELCAFLDGTPVVVGSVVGDILDGLVEQKIVSHANLGTVEGGLGDGCFGSVRIELEVFLNLWDLQYLGKVGFLS